jgi:hypothetical protein
VPKGRAREAEAETCDALITALRVFAVRSRRDEDAEESAPEPEPRPKRAYPHEVLVFDTETRSEPAQRLLFGVWRLYRDPAYGEPGATCIEEGIFYPDDLAETDPAGFDRLQRYADEVRAGTDAGFATRIAFMPLSLWLSERFYRFAWGHRHNCHVVGYNLPFDLGRLASYWSPARGYYRGGWSLGLWGNFDEKGDWHDLRFRRRLLMKAIDPRRTLFGWGSLNAENRDTPDRWKGFEARFVDLHTLVFALTDRNYTLERACRAFGDNFTKAKVRYGTISKRLIAYALRDVEHTAGLYRCCMGELRRHQGIELEPHRLYSPASVGARYLEVMGVERPLEKFKGLDPRIQGWSMSAFYGGRAEARIVRTPVPVAYLDAASMYPTVNALLGTWRLIAAAGVETRDATRAVRRLLSSDDLLGRLLKRDTWTEDVGVTLVQLDAPDGDILPVRGRYDPASADYGIGVNPLRYDGTLWYMLPDVIASALLVGRIPKIARALRLHAVGVQDGLRSVRLRGGQEIDPAGPTADPFVTMVEERRRAERDPALDAEERERLGLFLKITANATSYGTLARFDRKEREKRQTVTVYGPDDVPVKAKTRSPEDPGPFCFPPVAASLTAAARLMLAMLEHMVTAAGGSYAFCDTDSMAVVYKPRGGTVRCRTQTRNSIRALSRNELTAIVERFADLNPYERGLVPELWKEQHGSMAEPLLCYAISAKRYVLYRERDGRPAEIVRVGDAPEEDAGAEETADASEESGGLLDWSEHGLGMYLDPRNPDDPQRDDEERRTWMREAWEWVLARDPARPLPGWASRYALTRFTVSSPTIAKWFAGFDNSMPADDRIRPGCFGLIAHPEFVLNESGEPSRLPTAVYESNPDRWPSLDWYDRSSGRPVRVTTVQPGEDPEAFARAMRNGAISIQRIADVISRYPMRGEAKSLARDGRPVTAETSGRLIRRVVTSAPVLTEFTGKEGAKLAERLTGEVWSVEEYRADFGVRGDRWQMLALPVLRHLRRQLGTNRLAQAVGLSRRSVERATRLRNPTHPHERTKIRYLSAAIAYLTDTPPPTTSLSDLYASLYCGSRTSGDR